MWNRNAQLIKDSSDVNYDKQYYEVNYSLDNIYFVPETNQLQFKVKRIVIRPKITKYIFRNKKRIPILGDLSERTRIIVKFDRQINVKNFIKIELPAIKKLPSDIKVEIIEYLNQFNEISLLPSWFIKHKKIQFEKNKINVLEKEIQDYKICIKKIDSDISHKQKILKFLKTIKSKQSPNWFLILSIVTIPLVIGIFLYLFFYVDEQNAIVNKARIEELEKELIILETQLEKKIKHYEILYKENIIKINNHKEVIKKIESQQFNNNLEIRTKDYNDIVNKVQNNNSLALSDEFSSMKNLDVETLVKLLTEHDEKQ